MTTDDPRDLFGAARPPAPPAALRERVLSAARAVPRRVEAGVGIVDGIWESRTVRWGWALLVSALLLGHVVVSDRNAHAPSVASVEEGQEAEPRNDEASFAALEIPWVRPRIQARHTRMIDAILDPSLAESALREEP
jgi:hypothetical protein